MSQLQENGRTELAYFQGGPSAAALLVPNLVVPVGSSHGSSASGIHSGRGFSAAANKHSATAAGALCASETVLEAAVTSTEISARRKGGADDALGPTGRQSTGRYEKVPAVASSGDACDSEVQERLPFASGSRAAPGAATRKTLSKAHKIDPAAAPGARAATSNKGQVQLGHYFKKTG
jgi:hypothetical protein